MFHSLSYSYYTGGGSNWTGMDFKKKGVGSTRFCYELNREKIRFIELENPMFIWKGPKKQRQIITKLR